MTRECSGIPEDDEFHSCSRDGDIHAPQVAEEPDLSLFVSAYQRKDNDIALLSLETVDGSYGDEVTEGL